MYSEILRRAAPPSYKSVARIQTSQNRPNASAAAEIASITALRRLRDRYTGFEASIAFVVISGSRPFLQSKARQQELCQSEH